MFNFKNSYQILSFIIVIIYIYYLQHFSVNIPQYEDYGNILSFLINFIESETLHDKAKLFLVSTQEHINITSKLIATVIYSLFGYINLKFLVLIGNLCLIIFVIQFNALIVDNNGYMKLIPFLLLLNIMPYEINTWGLTSIQHFSTILFVLLAIKYAVRKELKYNLIAIVFSIIATGSFGNGMVVFIVIIAYKILAKEFKFLFIWTLSFSLILLSYYFLVSGLKARFFMYYNPLAIIQYGLNLYGTMLHTNQLIASSFGLFIIISFIILLLKNFKKLLHEQPILLMLISFVNISMILIIISRSHISVNHAFISNYKFISLLNLLLLLVLYSKYSNFVLKKQSILTVSVIIYLLSFILYLPKAKEKKNNLIVSFDNIEDYKFWYNQSIIKKCKKLNIADFE